MYQKAPHVVKLFLIVILNVVKDLSYLDLI